jgi:hypothetical protein
VPVLRPGLIDTTALRLVAPAAMLLMFSRSGAGEQMMGGQCYEGR